MPPELSVVGLHANPVRVTGAVRETVAVCIVPFSVAVMLPVWLLAIFPAVTVKVPIVLPAATISEAGTARAVPLFDRLTVAPAVLDTVAVQVALPPETRLVGLQVNPLSVTGAVSDIVAVCALPFSDPVRVAVWLLAIVPAVALKVADVLPDPIVTEAGTVNAVALLDKETATAPEGAGAFNEIVQIDVPPVLSDAGTQLMALTRGAVVITPPTPVIGNEFAPVLAPKVFVTPIGAVVTPDATVTLTCATTPFWITPPFIPARIQR